MIFEILSLLQYLITDKREKVTLESNLESHAFIRYWDDSLSYKRHELAYIRPVCH